MPENKLDPYVSFAIPSELSVEEYRTWIDRDLVPEWLRSEGNVEYVCKTPTGDWNYEGAIFGKFKGVFVSHVKFYKSDETQYQGSKFRGITILNNRFHNSVQEVHQVADSLEKFLKEKEIPYQRENRERNR